MMVEATIDGEYKNHLLLKIYEEGSTMRVSAGFQPNFVNPNDKLSAHKVISIALKITVPRYKNVFVYGNSSNVTVKGAYTNLKITLADGRCILDDVSETVEVITQSGNIFVNSPRADIKTVTKYGKIYRDPIPEGDYQFNLNTTSGDINLKKIE